HRSGRAGTRGARRAGAAVQGRLRRTGFRGVPRPARRRQVVRQVPADPDVRARVPHDRHPRSPADRDHQVAGAAPTPGQLRAPDAVRGQARGAAPAGRDRRPGAGVRAVRQRLVRLPGAAAGRAAGEPGVLPAFAMVGVMIAILGAGKMGEALLSGLLRAGRPPSDVAVVVRRADRGEELYEAYGVPVLTPEEAAKAASTLGIAAK